VLAVHPRELRVPMKWPSFFLFVLTGALLFVLPGCETDRGDKPRARTGETYPATSGTFRDRWWSHYERGLQYASGLNWREAAEDFREAIRRRDRDTRRAKTYGMHFIDYFPHRELGVVLVHQERFEEAIPELEASLRDEKSAKAEFYLDWARKTLLQRAGRDTGPPHIVIQSPDEGAITNRLNCGVTAHVRDDSFVKSVKVGDGYVRLDLAVREVPVQMDVPLAVGNNVLRIEARDLSGNIAVAERKITVDRQGPVISIQAPPDGASPAGSSLRLRGYVTDDCGIAEIKINGQKREHLPGKEILLDFPIPASPELSPTVIEARDLAGNTTRAEIPLSGQVSVFPRILLASLDPLHIALLKSAAARHDSLAPVIELRDWTEHQTVFLDEIYLEGAVKGAGKVSTLTINGHSTLIWPGLAKETMFFPLRPRMKQAIG
jgi:hypothetical protein